MFNIRLFLNLILKVYDLTSLEEFLKGIKKVPIEKQTDVEIKVLTTIEENQEMLKEHIFLRLTKEEKINEKGDLEFHVYEKYYSHNDEQKAYFWAKNGCASLKPIYSNNNLVISIGKRSDSELAQITITTVKLGSYRILRIHYYIGGKNAIQFAEKIKALFYTKPKSGVNLHLVEAKEAIISA